jgi:hypothetical protein
MPPLLSAVAACVAARVVIACVVSARVVIACVVIACVVIGGEPRYRHLAPSY